MGLEKPKDGAYQALEGVEKPVNGACEMCEAVCKPVNGAWEEIWNAIKWLIESENTISNGMLSIQNEGMLLYYTKWEDYYDGEKDGDIGGTGTITFYVEGKWNNPAISFDYEGGMVRSDASATTWYTGNAGEIFIYSRTTDGTEETTKVVDSVGIAASGTNISTDNEKGSYRGMLQGTFDRIGISIHMTGYSSATHYYNANVDMKVSNMLINSTKIGFPEASEFDYT